MPASYVNDDETVMFRSLTLSETAIQKDINPLLTSKRTNWQCFKELSEVKIKLKVPIRRKI